VSRRTGAPRIGLIVLTLVGIALASAGLATAVTMSVSGPVEARADLASIVGEAPAAPRAPAAAATPDPQASEEWKPVPVDAAGNRSITDLTGGAVSRVTVDVLGMDLSPGQAGALVATILSLPLLIAVAVLVAAPRPRRWWRRLTRRSRV
jgi:Mn2+/Fe2+ NRAMP family transporter